MRVVKSQGDGVLQAEFSHEEQQWKCSIEIRRAREGVLWGETHGVVRGEPDRRRLAQPRRGQRESVGQVLSAVW